MSGLNWNPTQTIKIKHVTRMPCLYNIRIKSFSSRSKTLLATQEECNKQKCFECCSISLWENPDYTAQYVQIVLLSLDGGEASKETQSFVSWKLYNLCTYIAKVSLLSLQYILLWISKVDFNSYAYDFCCLPCLAKNNHMR